MPVLADRKRYKLRIDGVDLTRLVHSITINFFDECICDIELLPQFLCDENGDVRQHLKGLKKAKT